LAQVQVVPLILAGKRSSDPLSKNFQVPNKAFIHLAGKTMLSWVVDAIKQAELQPPYMLSITRSQQEIFEDALSDVLCELILNDEDESPVQASMKALKGLQPTQGLLITTADNPLLTAEIINHFLNKCQSSSADLVIGTVNGKQQLLQDYPEVRRTWHKLNPNCWLSGCNLFFWSPEGFREGTLDTLCQLEEKRKSPILFASTVARLDLKFLLKLCLQRTSIEECSQALSRATRVKTELVTLPFPEACIDVDTMTDLELAQKILSKRSK